MACLVSKVLHSSRWNAVTIDYLTIKPTHLTTNPAVRATKYARLSGKALINNISTEIAHNVTQHMLLDDYTTVYIYEDVYRLD